VTDKARVSIPWEAKCSGIVEEEATESSSTTSPESSSLCLLDSVDFEG